MSRTALKFIKDRSVTSDPLKLIQWDADGDLAYVPVDNADWDVTPTGALQGLDELAQRVSDIEIPLIQAKTANFTAVNKGIYLTTNAINAQLPAPTLGTKVTIIKKDASTVTVVRNGTEKIHGITASYSMTSEKQSLTFFADGTDWYLI